MSHRCDMITNEAIVILDCTPLSLIWSYDLLIFVQVSSDDLNRNRSCLNTI